MGVLALHRLEVKLLTWLALMAEAHHFGLKRMERHAERLRRLPKGPLGVA